MKELELRPKNSFGNSSQNQLTYECLKCGQSFSEEQIISRRKKLPSIKDHPYDYRLIRCSCGGVISRL